MQEKLKKSSSKLKKDPTCRSTTDKMSHRIQSTTKVKEQQSTPCLKLKRINHKTQGKHHK